MAKLAAKKALKAGNRELKEGQEEAAWAIYPTSCSNLDCFLDMDKVPV